MPEQPCDLILCQNVQGNNAEIDLSVGLLLHEYLFVGSGAQELEEDAFGVLLDH